MVLWNNVDAEYGDTDRTFGSAGVYLEKERKVRYVKFAAGGKKTVGEVLLPSNIVAVEDVIMYVMYKKPNLKTDIRESQMNGEVWMSDFDKMMEEREILDILDGGGYPMNYSIRRKVEPEPMWEAAYAPPEYFKPMSEAYAPPEYFDPSWRSREEEEKGYKTRMEEEKKKKSK